MDGPGPLGLARLSINLLNWEVIISATYLFKMANYYNLLLRKRESYMRLCGCSNLLFGFFEYDGFEPLF